jgi:hypothetical protein
MKGKRSAVFIIVFLLLSSFFVYNFINAMLPMPKVKAEGNTTIPVKQGSYCWDGFLSNGCVDMVEPFMMMSDEKLIHVKPKEEITIIYNRNPLKEPKTVTLWTKNKSEPKGALLKTGGILQAPREKGIYAVSTHGIWKRGSVSHVFFIEVR